MHGRRRGAPRRATADLLWYDGTLWGFADNSAWDEYISHGYVVAVLSQYQLGGTRVDGCVRPLRDCLLLGTSERRLYAVPLAAALALVRRTGDEALYRLPEIQQPAYLRAAASVLGQAVDAVRMRQRRNDGIAGLKDWLDGKGVPF